MLEQTEISSLYENTCFRWGIQGRKNIVLSQYISNMNRQLEYCAVFTTSFS